jgi:hypothetical protein
MPSISLEELEIAKSNANTYYPCFPKSTNIFQILAMFSVE